MMSTRLPNEEQPVDPAAQAKAQSILHGEPSNLNAGMSSTPPTIPAGYHRGKDGKIRKDRADAGQKRVATPEPPAPATGKLTKEQRARLVDLIQSKDTRYVQFEAAQTRADECDKAFATAQEELDAFIDSLTA